MLLGHPLNALHGIRIDVFIGDTMLRVAWDVKVYNNFIIKQLIIV
jgi:hypothetical protein